MIIGQYKILEKIGEGGMGVVYKGEHVTLEQIVALKSLPAALSANSEMRERFIREAKIQAKLSHPNVVSLLNFFEHEGSFYLVMEYVEGETLASMIKRVGLITPEKCISIFEQVLAGLGFAHTKGIIHRDIKPSNLMINAEGAVKITDFGIAKIAGDLQKTQTGVKVGTLSYMSPEQVKGQTVGIASDIYSLGITLFEMVTGRIPFTGDSEFDVMKTIVESPPPSPKEFYPYIPEQLEKAILKAVSKSPSDRFQSTRAFSDALRGETISITERGPQTYVPSRSEKPDESLNLLSKLKFRERRFLLPLASIFVLVIVALIYFFVFEGKEPNQLGHQAIPTPKAVSPDSPRQIQTPVSTALPEPSQIKESKRSNTAKINKEPKKEGAQTTMQSNVQDKPSGNNPITGEQAPVQSNVSTDRQPQDTPKDKGSSWQKMRIKE